MLLEQMFKGIFHWHYSTCNTLSTTIYQVIVPHLHYIDIHSRQTTWTDKVMMMPWSSYSLFFLFFSVSLSLSQFSPHFEGNTCVYTSLRGRPMNANSSRSNKKLHCMFNSYSRLTTHNPLQLCIVEKSASCLRIPLQRGLVTRKALPWHDIFMT